jgi:hypothetical protein
MSKVIRFHALQQLDLVFTHNIFEQIELPAAFIWNTLLRVLRVMHQKPKVAIVFYKKAQGKGMKPDNLIFPFVSRACAKTYAHKEGEQMHDHVIKLGFLLGIFVSNSLIHLMLLDCLRSSVSVQDLSLMRC